MTNELPTDYLLQTKDKFQDLFKEQKGVVGDLQDKDFQLKEEIEVLEEKKKRLKIKQEELGKISKSEKELCDIKIAEVKAKLASAVKTREELTDREAKIKAQFLEAKEENDKLQRVVQAKELENRIHREIYDEEVNQLEEQIARKISILKESKDKQEKLTEMIKNDEKVFSLTLKKKQLEESLLEKEKSHAEIAYKVLEAEYLQRLAVQQKELDAEERRKFYDEFERLKTLLEETEKINEMKVIRKIKENEALDYKKIEVQLTKEQRDLSEIRDKADGIHLIYKKIKGEVEQMEKKSDLQKKDIESKLDKIKVIEEKLAIINPELSANQSSFEENTFKEAALLKERDRLVKENNENEMQVNLLTTRIDFIKRYFDFSKVVNVVKVDDLKQQLHENLQTNEAMANLIQKLETLKQIQKTL